MSYNIKIGVIGGDLRQLVCASALADEGFEVGVYGFELCERESYGKAVRCRSLGSAISGASVVILPVPVTADTFRLKCPLCDREIRMESLYAELPAGEFVLGGMLDPSFIAFAEEKGITAYDYMKDEELAVKNAIPTAEGALYAAMRDMNITVRGCKTAVFGYGRVGKLTADLFAACGAKVTVLARRREALAYALARGLEGRHINEAVEVCAGADLVINTVPSEVITPVVLRGMKKSAVIIDLASAPGGVDRDYASSLGIKTSAELSLPGKVAPITSGLYIKDAVMKALKNRGVI